MIYKGILLSPYVCVAPCQLAIARARVRDDPRDGSDQAVAAADAGDGGGIDRPCVEPERSAAVPRAAVAAVPSPLRHRRRTGS